MYGSWLKAGKGGSYAGYFKLRNPINKVSSAQREQRNKFRKAVASCKGKNKSDFLACMSDAL